MDPIEIAKLINEDFDELTPTKKGRVKLITETTIMPDEADDLGITGEDLPTGETPAPDDIPLDTPPTAGVPAAPAAPAKGGITGKDAKAIENVDLAQNLEDELAAASGEQDTNNEVAAAATATNTQNIQKVADAVNKIKVSQKKAQAEQDKAKAEKATLEKLTGTDDINKATEEIVKNVAGNSTPSIPEWRTNFEKALDETFGGRKVKKS